MLVHHAFAVLPLVALAYSSPLVGRNPHICDTGTAQCCQSVQSSDSSAASLLAPLLSGISLANGPIGLGCTSLTGAGSGVNCGSNPVCCNNTYYNGLINVGCSPISL